MSILHLKTKVLSGGWIEFEAPGLDVPPLKGRTDDILFNYPGGRHFETGAEVDPDISEERVTGDD